MTEPITIGVDHGYAAMKTAHCSFPSGLAEYEHEPYTQKNVLCYDGKYYVVGSGRQPLQKDKTADENYYLLTLAAIAKEIAYRNAPTTTPVILAAGLPLTSFIFGFFPHTQTGKFGGQVQPVASSCMVFFTMRSSSE
mgnify:CR=1 FL=1